MQRSASPLTWLETIRAQLTLLLLAGALTIFSPASAAIAQPSPPPTETVRGVLAAPDDQLNFGQAKLAFDRIIDSSIDADATIAEVERLAERAAALAGPRATDIAKLAAVRRVIYQSGAWNGSRPFSYDLADPFGRNVRNKLLATYLRTRRGNCVSMPILFLLVGERLGLNLSLSTAPLHIFVRYTDPAGREMNLETTSGGHPSRTVFYRQQMPMSDRAIASGLYMRTLSKREVVALMATTVTEFLIGERRFEEAIMVGEIILQNAPRDGLTMVHVGSSYGQLMISEFGENLPSPILFPPHLRTRYVMLAQRNQGLFQAAEALGWGSVPDR